VPLGVREPVHGRELEAGGGADLAEHVLGRCRSASADGLDPTREVPGPTTPDRR
jgi:hypothetical protein